MRKLRRLAALLLTLAMVLTLSACSSDQKVEENTAGSEAVSAGATKTQETAPAEAAASSEVYPEETIKIGVVTFDTASDQFLAVQKYYAYLADNFNLEFVYSESINSAEGELAFIESCASAGCKAIIGYYNVSRAEAVQLTIDKGMYYYGVAEEDSVYETFKSNPYYLGSYYLGNGDYEQGYAIGEALAKNGSKNIVYVSGGKDFGIKMFIDRAEGFYAAIDDANKNGADIKVVSEVPGWPGTDAYSAGQAAALDMDIDGVACSFGAATWLQPIETAGKSADVKIAAIDSLLDIYASPFEAGQVVCLAAESMGRYGLAIPVIINSVEGNSACVRDNGLAPRVPVNIMPIITAEEFNTQYSIENDGIYTFDAKDIASVIYDLNGETNYENLVRLWDADSSEKVMARRSAE